MPQDHSHTRARVQVDILSVVRQNCNMVNLFDSFSLIESDVTDPDRRGDVKIHVRISRVVHLSVSLLLLGLITHGYKS